METAHNGLISPKQKFATSKHMKNLKVVGSFALALLHISRMSDSSKEEEESSMQKWNTYKRLSNNSNNKEGSTTKMKRKKKKNKKVVVVALKLHDGGKDPTTNGGKDHNNHSRKSFPKWVIKITKKVRIMSLLTSPAANFLRRLRDAYVKVMMAMAGKGSSYGLGMANQSLAGGTLLYPNSAISKLPASLILDSVGDYGSRNKQYMEILKRLASQQHLSLSS